MFFIIPISVIIFCLAGVSFIVSRKWSYAKKLTPDSHQFSETIFHDFFPELFNLTNSSKLKEYRQSFLKEIEKLLRRLRVASLKIDYTSDSLIKRIRKVHVANTIEQETLDNIELDKNEAINSEEDRLKKQEQDLIIEIAKNPKEFNLYDKLGDLYLQMNDSTQAQEAYEAALALDPNNQDLARKYSKLLKKGDSSSVAN